MREFRYTAVSVAVLTGIVFIAQQLWESEVFNALALVSSEVWAKPWTLITHVLVHADIMHFGYNMFALLLFGTILEYAIGSRRFLVVYIASGLAAGIAGVFLYTAAIGASGAVFGVLGCLAILRPRLVVWVMGAPMPMIVASFVWVLIDFIGMFSYDNVAHEAHLFGLGLGAAAGLLMHRRYGEPLMKRKKDEEYPTSEDMKEWEDRYMLSG